jgi:hemolysin activation/secretion protein
MGPLPSLLVAVFLSLSAEPNPILKDIDLTGVRTFERAEVLSVVRPFLGRELTEDLLEAAIGRILAYYEERGLPLASVSPLSYRELEDGTEVHLEVREGPLVRPGSVRVSGNSRTRSWVIRRFFPTEKTVFRRSDFERGRLALEREGLVRVSGYDFIEDQGGLHLLLHVTEQAANRLFGALIYNPKEETFQGQLALDARNLLGTGRSLEVDWRRLRLEEQILTVEYREPWLFGSDLALLLDLQYEFRESLYTKEEAAVGVELNLFALKAAFLARYGRYSDRSSDERVSRAVSEARVTGRFGEFPVQTEVSADVQISTVLQKARISVGLIRPLPGPLYVHLRAGGMLSESPNDLLTYDLHPLGGLKDVRGYEEGQFLVERAAFGGLALGVRFGRQTALFVFQDVAYAEFGDREESLRGRGIGLTGRVLQGTLTLSYAVAKGEDPLRGKVHVGVETFF